MATLSYNEWDSGDYGTRAQATQAYSDYLDDQGLSPTDRASAWDTVRTGLQIGTPGPTGSVYAGPAAMALPVASNPTPTPAPNPGNAPVTTEPAKPNTPSGGPTTNPVGPPQPSQPSQPGQTAPTPFQTPDPLAFVPLSTATTQMAPGTTPSAPTTPTNVPPAQVAPPGTPVATPPTQWSLSDPRTQAEILAEDYGGDYNKFIAASPNASVAAQAALPGFNTGVGYGDNGSVIAKGTGATTSGPNAALAPVITATQNPANQTVGAPLGQGGVGGIGGNTTPTSIATTPGSGPSQSGTNGLPPIDFSGVDFGSPTPPNVNVPAPIQAPMPWELPASSVSPTVSPSATPSPAGQPNAPASTASSSPVPAPAASSPNTPVQPSQAPTTDANGLPATSGAMSAVNLTPTTPSNALTNFTISPGALADRYSTAKTQYDDWVTQTDPQFQAANRDALRYAAAGGTIGSGQLNTSLGDIQLNRENAMRSSRDTFLGNALNASIDDAYKNIGIAQQQQAFQQGQQATAFNQNVTLQTLRDSELGQQFQQLMTTLGFNSQQQQQAFENAFKVQQLSDDETGQSFYRALQQAILGYSNDPASYMTWLAGQYAQPSRAAA